MTKLFKEFENVPQKNRIAFLILLPVAIAVSVLLFFIMIATNIPIKPHNKEYDEMISEYGEPFKGLELGKYGVDRDKLLGEPHKDPDRFYNYVYYDYKVWGIKGTIKLNTTGDAGLIYEYNWSPDDRSDKDKMKKLNELYIYHIETNVPYYYNITDKEMRYRAWYVQGDESKEVIKIYYDKDGTLSSIDAFWYPDK